MFKVAVAALIASAALCPAMAADPAGSQPAIKNTLPSPTPSNAIFGRAAVEKNTTAENKTVAGKGYWADYFGYYGTQYAQYAYQAGLYGDWWSGRYWSDAAADAFDSAIAHYNLGL